MRKGADILLSAKERIQCTVYTHRLRLRMLLGGQSEEVMTIVEKIRKQEQWLKRKRASKQSSLLLHNGGCYFENVNFRRHHNNVFVCVYKATTIKDLPSLMEFKYQFLPISVEYSALL